MDADGGKEKYGNAGAQLGLGYCDAQCPHDLKFNDKGKMKSLADAFLMADDYAYKLFRLKNKDLIASFTSSMLWMPRPRI